MPQNNCVHSIAYFPPISWFATAIHQHYLMIDASENYQKQSYRNRCIIQGPNGKLSLSIPIEHSKREKLKTSEVVISHKEDWRKQHWKSIESSYRRSAYFEYYEDQFELIYKEPKLSLWDFNLRSIELALNLLQVSLPLNFIEHYHPSESFEKDYRDIIHPKKPVLKGNHTYFQVFSDRMPFLSDLSILDLIFNLGPQSLEYLKNVSINNS